MALSNTEISALQKEAGLGDTPQASAHILGFVVKNFSGDFAVISSFGAESVVLLHLIAEQSRDVPVFFLDTGRHFPQTLAYRDELVKFLKLRDVRTLRPDPKRVAFEDPDHLMAELDPDRCCEIRKVLPMKAVEPQFDIWATGRKRMQATTRAHLPVVEIVEKGRVKLNPLAGWDAPMIKSYMEEHHLPQHPLVKLGYKSIGCAPCTRPVKAGEDSRAGRWAGQKKTECGLHKPSTASS